MVAGEDGRGGRGICSRYAVREREEERERKKEREKVVEWLCWTWEQGDVASLSLHGAGY